MKATALRRFDRVCLERMGNIPAGVERAVWVPAGQALELTREERACDWLREHLTPMAGVCEAARLMGWEG